MIPTLKSVVSFFNDPDLDLRIWAVRWVNSVAAGSPDPEHLTAALSAILRNPQHAVDPFLRLTADWQPAATHIPQILALINSEDVDVTEESIEILSNFLVQCPLAAIDEHERAILEELDIDGATLQQIARRRDFSTWPVEQLWRELREMDAAFLSPAYATQSSPIESLLTTAGGGFDPRLSGPVDGAHGGSDDGSIGLYGFYRHDLYNSLAAHPNFDDQLLLKMLERAVRGAPPAVMYGAAYLAGRRRLVAAAAGLVELMICEEPEVQYVAGKSLARIGGKAAVDALEKRVLSVPLDSATFLIDGLSRIVAPESEAVVLSLIDKTKNVNIQSALCLSLVNMLSSEADAQVRRQLRAGATNPHILVDLLQKAMYILGKPLSGSELTDLARLGRSTPVAHRPSFDPATITILTPGQAPHPTLALSSDAVTSQIKMLSQLPSLDEPPPDFDEEPVTIRHAGARVGRNDPCPCGSGRKYKKCCGRS